MSCTHALRGRLAAARPKLPDILHPAGLSGISSTTLPVPQMRQVDLRQSAFDDLFRASNDNQRRNTAM